jgi:small-conductance mechanosensitive channel
MSHGIGSTMIGVASAVLMQDTASGAPDPGDGLMALPSEVQAQLLASAATLGLILLLRRAVLGLVRKQVDDPTLLYKWGKASGYVASVIGLLAMVQIWFSAIRSLGTFLGLLTAGLAIALKDLVADFAGWVFILLTRPFDHGDRIQIGELAGDVVDRRIFQFTIMEIGNWVDADQSTGRVVHVPNAKIFTQPLANYTSGFSYLWNEIPVCVTFESDWRRAKKIMAEIASRVTADVIAEAQNPMHRANQRFPIQYRTLTPAVYTSVEADGVLLTLRYLCRPRQRRGTAQELWEDILDAFGEESDVDFAYPTQRLLVEGAAERPTRPSEATPKDARE